MSSHLSYNNLIITYRFLGDKTRNTHLFHLEIYLFIIQNSETSIDKQNN